MNLSVKHENLVSQVVLKHYSLFVWCVPLILKQLLQHETIINSLIFKACYTEYNLVRMMRKQGLQH